MMSKTHLAIGLTASLAIVQPTTFHQCAVAVIGGAVGGVLADNDLLSDSQANALTGQGVAFGIAGIALVLDYLFGFGICQFVMAQPRLSAIGGIVFVLLYVIGMGFRHRTFTHSFIAMILYTAAVSFIYAPISKAFATAYCSHLFLDVLNKKKVYLFFPLNCGICLKMCYANKKANTVFWHIGLGVSCVLLIAGIIESFSV